jgi:hypothetical protein
MQRRQRRLLLRQCLCQAVQPLLAHVQQLPRVFKAVVCDRLHTGSVPHTFHIVAGGRDQGLLLQDLRAQPHIRPRLSVLHPRRHKGGLQRFGGRRAQRTVAPQHRRSRQHHTGDHFKTHMLCPHQENTRHGK